MRARPEHRRLHRAGTRRPGHRAPHTRRRQHLPRVAAVDWRVRGGSRMNSILIVEDEPVLARALRDNFSRQGWDVATATDGETGLNFACSRRFDLILLDIMLPRVNGYEICRALRQGGNQSPIMILTAKSQEEDVILGLNLGADDYLAKPFRRGELLARANALVRRSKG